MEQSIKWCRRKGKDLFVLEEGMYAMSLDEIAEELGVTKQRVGQIIDGALRKIVASGALDEFGGPR